MRTIVKTKNEKERIKMFENEFTEGEPVLKPRVQKKPKFSKEQLLKQAF